MYDLFWQVVDKTGPFLRLFHSIHPLSLPPSSPVLTITTFPLSYSPATFEQIIERVILQYADVPHWSLAAAVVAVPLLVLVMLYTSNIPS